MNTEWIISPDIKRQLSMAKVQALLHRNSILELGRYKKPPAGVEVVTRAATVLMGYKESETSSWAQLKRLFADPNVIHTLLAIRMYHLTVERALKARELLGDFNLTAAFSTSTALVALYEWVFWMIEYVMASVKDPR